MGRPHDGPSRTIPSLAIGLALVGAVLLFVRRLYEEFETPKVALVRTLGLSCLAGLAVSRALLVLRRQQGAGPAVTSSAVTTAAQGRGAQGGAGRWMDRAVAAWVVAEIVATLASRWP